TLWACYLFDIGRLDESEMIRRGWWRHAFPPSVAKIPIPMPSLPLGIATVVSHNKHEHEVYLNGQVHQVGQGGWWYYFPEALVVKSPLSLSIGLLLAAALAFKRIRRPKLSVAIAATAAIFLAFSMTSSVQIGVRYLLPIIPLAYVLIVLQLTR